jgi:HAD superfamily hydrolase (TIGR01509 family)
MVIKAVLFDIDGTLVDSNDYHVAAWQTAFRRVGANFDDRAVHDQIGKGTDMLVPTLLPETDEAEQEALGEEHGRIFKAQFLSQVVPFAAARQLLVAVRESGRQVVLASSASSDELDHYLDLLDARDLVAATASGDDVEKTKPAPDIVGAALGKLAGVAPAETLMVGDTPYDVEAAAQCGVRTVAVRSGGFADEALTAAGAIAIYDDVAALLEGYEALPLGRLDEA